jgi:hypothetical protein
MKIVSKKSTVNLTYGKVYDVIDSEDTPGRFKIINDRGQERTSSVDNFMNLEEYREFKLKELLEEKNL